MDDGCRRPFISNAVPVIYEGEASLTTKKNASLPARRFFLEKWPLPV